MQSLNSTVFIIHSTNNHFIVLQFHPRMLYRIKTNQFYITMDIITQSIAHITDQYDGAVCTAIKVDIFAKHMLLLRLSMVKNELNSPELIIMIQNERMILKSMTFQYFKHKIQPQSIKRFFNQYILCSIINSLFTQY